MRKNVKRTIAVLSAVCMLPCPQVANVAVMAQNVSVGSSIGAKTLKQSLQTSTNFETASGKRREVKENNIEDSYDITYGDSITFFVSKTKIPNQDQTDNSGNEDDQKQDDGQKDSETDVIPDYEVPDTINGFSFNKEETDDGKLSSYRVSFLVTGCELNHYYRARAMHLVEWDGDQMEGKATETDGVLLTDHEV